MHHESNPHATPRNRHLLQAVMVSVLAVSGTCVWSDPCVDRLEEVATMEPTAPEEAPIFEPFGAVVRAGLRELDAPMVSHGGSRPLPASPASNPASPALHPWKARATLGLAHRLGESTPRTSTAIETALVVTRTLDDGGEMAHREQAQRHLTQAVQHEHGAALERKAEQLATLLLERDRHRRKVLIASRWSRQLQCAAQASSAITRDNVAQALKASLEHAETLELDARRALRHTSHQLRGMLGDGLPLTTGIAAGRLSAALRAMPSMTPQDSSRWAAVEARTAASDARLMAQRAAWSPRWDAFAGVRTMGSSPSGSSSDAGLMVGLSLQFDLDRARVNSALDQAERELDAVKRLASADMQWRQRAIDEQRTSADQAMNRARRIAAMLRDSETLGAPTAGEWRSADTPSATQQIKAMRSHFELQVAYVDAWHDAQAATINALALGGKLIEWLE